MDYLSQERFSRCNSVAKKARSLKVATQEDRSMITYFWTLLKKTIVAFIDDGVLSRGASVSFYTVTSLAPLLLIVVAIAGLVFGRDAASNAIFAQFNTLVGPESANMLQAIIKGASDKVAGTIATTVGLVTLLITASGVFGEIQTSLNAIWKTSPQGTTFTRLVRARAASLGLVAVLGFLLLVSLVVSTVLNALSGYIDSFLPFGSVILHLANTVISFGLLTLLFAAIYKILPDIGLHWRDVWVGASVTSFLFTIGKTLISLYIGSSAVASTYGAASAIVVLLLWIYYSSQIFFLGAEFTKVYAEDRGSLRPLPNGEASQMLGSPKAANPLKVD